MIVLSSRCERRSICKHSIWTIFTFKHTDGSTHTIDAFDLILNRVTSLGGFANDPLDESRENARWHNDGNRLYLRATRDIKAHEQIIIHYGVNY